MLDRDGYPPGVPCWVDTAQPDPEAAVRFYGGLFGWEFEDRMPSEAPGNYFVARLRDRDVAALGSQQDGSQHNGAQLVNEPGTWNFSDLNTRDVDGAKAFYGAVFGWVADTFTGGGMEFTMLRLPGYGDFLEQRDPDLRTRQAEINAPPGFEDVVAGLLPMTSDRFPDDVPAHWSVTFTVDDTDAIAARAAELGGTVMAPPFDAGPTRVAVLRDPQGAAFAVSKFDPESI